MSTSNYHPPASFLIDQHRLQRAPMPSRVTPEASYKPAVSFYLNQRHHRSHALGGIMRNQLPPPSSSSSLSSSNPANNVNSQGRVMMECRSMREHIAHHSNDHRGVMGVGRSSGSSSTRREHQHDQRYPTIQMQQQQIRSPPLVKKKVSFSPTCTVVLDNRRRDPDISTNTTNAKEDSTNVLYYTKSELNTMYRETRTICSLSRALAPDHPDHDDSITNSNDSSVTRLLVKAARQDTIFAPESLRGLELMIYPTRRKNKYLAMQSFLKYQALLNSKKHAHQDVLSSEQKALALAIASTKLTAWSSLVAAETGRLDALAAYDADYLIPTTSISTGIEEKEEVAVAALLDTPFPFYKKQKATTRTNATSIAPTTTAASTVTTTAPITTAAPMNTHIMNHIKQERRWSRRVTVDVDEEQKVTNSSKRRKIML